MANGGLRNFEYDGVWSLPDGRLTERAKAWQRNLYDYIGARDGQIPVTSIGGDGSSTTTFLREDGEYAVPDYPAGSNPTAQVGTAAVNGSSNSFMRADAAPALNLGITPTWTGLHTFNNGLATTSLTASTTIRSTGGFGCNGATPQSAAAVNTAVGGTAGATYGATEQAMLNNITALGNQLRAILIANGQAV